MLLVHYIACGTPEVTIPLDMQRRHYYLAKSSAGFPTQTLLAASP